MVKESSKDSPSIKATNKFNDLSSFLYNRNTHDKSMFVNVDELNIIISIESILNSSKDKDRLYQLIHSNLSCLFNSKVTDDIKSLDKNDFKDICCYNALNDSYSGIESCIIRHLIDYHIDKFKEDVANENIRSLVKLSTSNDNFIIKLFPSKSDDDCPVSYCVSLLYLVLLHLYKHLHKDKDIVWILYRIFLRINPIITKVTYTTKIVGDDNYTWFEQLHQLQSAYKFLEINSDAENQVMFVFRPKEHYLTSTLVTPVENYAPSETNKEKRFIQCNYTLEKDNVLKCKTTILSKDMMDCVFATLIDKDDYLATMYSSLSDNETIYLAQYSIFRRLLSFTKQHEDLKLKLKPQARQDAKAGMFFNISDFSEDEIFQFITKDRTIDNAFKDISLPMQDDKIVQTIKAELVKQGQKNNLVDYIIVILELLNKDKNTISSTLELLDKRTVNKIQKVIKKLKKKIFTPQYSLNDFYKRV